MDAVDFLIDEFLEAIRVKTVPEAERAALGRIFEQVRQTPPWPEASAKAIEHLKKPNPNVAELASLIDAAMGVHFMAVAGELLANRQPKSVLDALQVLGLDRIQSVVAESALLAARDGLTTPDGFNQRGHWLYARLAATVASLLGQAVALDNLDAIQTAGLLIHLGKLTIAFCLPEEFAKIRAAKARGPVSSLALERDLIGLDHAQIGAAAARRFGLPGRICQAIWFHHHRPGLKMTEHWELKAVISAAARVCDAVALPGEEVYEALYARRRVMALLLQRSPRRTDEHLDDRDMAEVIRSRLDLAETRLTKTLLKTCGPRTDNCLTQAD